MLTLMHALPSPACQGEILGCGLSQWLVALLGPMHCHASSGLPGGDPRNEALLQLALQAAMHGLPTPCPSPPAPLCIPSRGNLTCEEQSSPDKMIFGRSQPVRAILHLTMCRWPTAETGTLTPTLDRPQLCTSLKLALVPGLGA